MNHRQGRARIFCITATLMLLSSGAALAGNLDSSAGPGDAASAMYTLRDLQNRLATGAAGGKRTGGFTEPGAGPGPTGASLNDIMALMPAADNASGATVNDVLAGKTFWGLNAATGQWGLQTGTLQTKTLSAGSTAVAAGYYEATDLSSVDADLASGNIKSGVSIFGVSGNPAVVNTASATATAGDIACGKTAYVNGALVQGTNCPTTTTTTIGRFTDNSNGTVIDALTGLIWLKNANPWSVQTWYDAGTYCASLASGTAGLTDGSTAGQWRLPTKEELEGIGTDPPVTWAGPGTPSVPWTMPGAPFTGVLSDYYWSSTSSADITNAWMVTMYNGNVFLDPKSDNYGYVWPVRSGP